MALGLSRTLGSLAFASVLASGAHGGQVTLFLENGNDGGGPFNTTQFRVRNDSNAGVSLTGLSLTVGDAALYNFDQIYDTVELFIAGDGTQSATLTLGDRAQDGLVTDSFAYTFANFAPGVTFRGQWDIDQDNGDFNADARLVMFNNGVAPNSVATFTFSDGSSFDYTFEDMPVQDTYEVSIPSPGALSVAALALLARRRR